MRNISGKIKAGFFTVMLLSLLALAGATVYADPPPWAPAHGYRNKEYKKAKKYKYIYYPTSQVYYSPERHGYYYPRPGGVGGWVFGVRLPNSIQLGRGVSIELGGPTPYDYHPTILNQYPAVIVGD